MSFANAQWQQVGPFGVAINCIIGIDSNVFVGTPSGLYLSTNNGNSWVSDNTGLPNISIYAITSSGANLIIGTNNGIYLSANNGSSWTNFSNGLPSKLIFNVLLVDSNRIFAGTSTGMFKATIEGSSISSWQTDTVGWPKNTSVSSIAIRDSNIFAGSNINGTTTGKGVYTSKINGTSWTAFNKGLPASLTGVSSLAISGSNIFAGTNSGVYLSSDNENSWTPVDSGLPLNENINSLIISNGNLFAGTIDNVYVSANNGTSWAVPYYGLSSTVGFYKNSNNLYLISNLYGVYLSTSNGTSWNAINTGLPAAVNVGAIVHNGSSIFIGTNTGVYLSTNNIRSWQLVNNGLPSYTKNISLALSGDSLYAGTDSGVYLTTNNGNLWNLVNTGIPKGTLVTALNISGQYIFAGTTNGIYYTNYIGTNWFLANYGLPANATIPSIANNGNITFIATSYVNGPLEDWWKVNGVYLFNNSQESVFWEPSESGIPLISHGFGAGIPSIALNGTKLFAATNAGVYFSSNNGENWALANSGLPPILRYTYNIYYYNVNILRTSGNYVFAGTSNYPLWDELPVINNFPGVYFSTNNGFSWTPINNGFSPNTGINAIDINDSFILAGTTNGLWMYPNITKSITVSTNVLSIGAPANSTKTFSITSDTSWVISNTQNWITPNITSGIYNSAITLTAQANPTTNPRIDTLTVTGKDLSSQIIIITQAAGGISVSTNKLNISYPANSTGTFTIDSDTTWTLSSNQMWLSPNITSGSGNKTITLTASANNNLVPRIDTVIVSAQSFNNDTIIVTQAGNGNLSLSTDTVNIAASANSQAFFAIYSNTAWTVKSQKTWIIPDIRSGSDSTTISLTASANPYNYSRTDTVIVTGNYLLPQYLIVTQAAGPPELSVSDKALNISSGYSNTLFSIYSNTVWTVQKDKNWLITNITDGIDSSIITVWAVPNQTINSRICTIIVSANGVKSDTVYISQAAGSPFLNVSANSFNVTSESNNEEAFIITSNVNWNVKSIKPWVALNYSAGNDTSLIALTISANTTINQRTDTITVTGTNLPAQIITVTQAAGSGTGVMDITEQDVKLYPIPVIDFLTISFPNLADQTRVVIYNLNGVEIYSSVIANPVTKIDMSKYPAGFYIVKIITQDNGIIARKIIKQ